MQAAAQAAAAAARVSAGANPNNPTQALPTVPDGLNAPNSTGPGLSVATSNGSPTLWVGANAPTQQTSTGANQSTQYKVTVTQTQQQAYLQWQTFDVGPNTSLVFDQSLGGASASNWIAFNYVRDPSARPSQILGSISTIGPSGDATTGGQVYILNTNGIIFGGASQVNAYALVASSLPINTNLVQRGLLNNPDDQFLFSTTSLASGSNGPTPVFNPSQAVAGVAPAQTPNLPTTTASGGYGDITVEPGATLTSPANQNVGGRVALVGPNVTNAGTIDTPDGQTILAAGLQVGWVASSDPSLRGLDVYVGSIGDSAANPNPPIGSATNADLGTALETGQASSAAGLIEVPEGDATIAGATVNQLGVLASSTSVSYNGRVDLLASYDSLSSGGFSTAPFFPLKTGTVTLGQDSLTEILPELDSTATIADTSLTLPSTVVVQGGTVAFGGNATSGAILLAPSANVAVDAGTWQFTQGGATSGVAPEDTVSAFTFNSGSISMAANSAVDVSGSENVSASVQEDIVAVQLLGPQLADSPLQRGGPLYGQTIDVNILDTGVYDGTPWVGTPLADTSGYVSLIPHTVGELTANGGSVAFNAGKSVSLAPGSTIDVAGGWINYQGGTVQTTKLLYNGQLVDISQANPNVAYQGIYTGTSTTTDSKWNVTSTTTAPVSLSTYLPSYVQGGNGGSLAITAGAMTLGGTLFGRTYAGANQRQPFVPYTSSSLQSVTAANIDPRVWELDSMPAASSLTLTFEEQYTVAPEIYDFYSPAPPDIYFSSTGVDPGDPNALVLSPGLTDPNATTYGGFGDLTVNDSADNETVNASNQLVVPAALSSPTITVPAGVTLQTAPGGSVSLAAMNVVLDGSIVSPGGAVTVTASDFWSGSPFLGTGTAAVGIPAYNPNRGNLTLGPGAEVNVAGLVVDNRTAAGGQTPLVTAGGSVSLAGSNVTLDSGAIVSVNGGAEISSAGKVSYGNAGAITLAAGEELLTAAQADLLGGSLSFDVADQLDLAPDLVPLQGYSGADGGSLAIQTSLIQVGVSPGTTPAAGTLLLPSDYAASGGFQSFFNTGGFSSFRLTGIGDEISLSNGGTPLVTSQGGVVSTAAVSIAAGTTANPTLIEPRVEQLQIVPSATGDAETQILSPPSYQNTPVALSFNAAGATDSAQGQTEFAAQTVRGDLVMAAGAKIDADPESSVSLTGNTVAVLGTVVAPGGAIAVKGGSDSVALFAGGVQGLPTVDLGPDSELSVAGTTLLTPDAAGRVPGDPDYVNTGSVLSGGSVTVSGNIVTESDPSNPDSVINVSGWSDTRDPWGLLEMAPPYSGASTGSGPVVDLVPTVVASNGGTITFNTGQSLFPDKPMVGAAGGPTAIGGTLTVDGQSLGTLPGSTGTFDTLQVTAQGPTIPEAFYTAGQTAIGNPVLSATGSPLTGDSLANIAVSSFSSGGFDSLNLLGAILFQGPVSIAVKGDLTLGGPAASLTGGSIYPGSGYVSATGAVTLSAAEVSVGQAYLPPVNAADVPDIFSKSGSVQYFPPTSGGGSLTVTAGSAADPGLINLGNLTLQNITNASFTSVAGSVQGYGTVDIAGNLTLAADLIYPSTAETLAIDAYPYTPKGGTVQPGTVTFQISDSAGDQPVPLSAGGTLDVYASVIDQDGVLRAPVGTINLGWDGTGAAPATDPISGVAVPSTQTLTLGSGSVTSVSGSSAGVLSGQGLPIPYGINLDGTSWISPLGNDITNSGPPAKTIDLDGATVAVASGAVVDTSGGGDLYAYQFIPGEGGTADILSASSGSFAVIPGYASSYAPNAAFNPLQAGNVSNLSNLLYPDPGYVSSGLAAGEQIRIDLGNGAGVQTYTLLPARYALLPGAYLITPEKTSAIPSAQPVIQPDGSYVSAGYTFSAFDPSQPLESEFAVASQSVVKTRADYANFSANTFFGQNAASTGSSAPPLPVDGGQLILDATKALSLIGSIDAAAASGGTGGTIAITSSENIDINGTGAGTAAGTLYLDSGELTAADPGSLLVGGTESSGTGGTVVTVKTPSLTVDNAGSPLEGSDIVLVANQNLTVAPNAEIEATGTLSTPATALQISDPIQLTPAATVSAATSASILTLARGGTDVVLPQAIPTGDTLTASVAGSYTPQGGTAVSFAKGALPSTIPAGSTITLNAAGTLTATGTGAAISLASSDGTLVRVSSSAAAPTSRATVVSSTAPTLQIGKGATLQGSSVTVDSTYLSAIDPTAVLSGAVSLSGGQISLFLDNTVASSTVATGLVLTPSTLADFQGNATSLSLSSYTSIDTYGAGTIGSSSFASLSLHAAEIRAFQAGTGGQGVQAGSSGQVQLIAQTVSLDDSPNGTDLGPVAGSTPAGTLNVEAGTIDLGANPLAIDQFANVDLTATGGVLFKGTGTLSVAGNLTVAAPVVAGATAASETITAGGAATLGAASGGVAAVSPGIGASLSLTGKSVAVGTEIALPSGDLTLEATGTSAAGGNLTVSGAVDLAGTAQTFGSSTSYTNGGQVDLISENGNVAVASGGSVDVAAQSGGGNAGSLSVSAVAGTFSVASSTAGTGAAAVPTLDGMASQAGGGQGGVFSMDVLNLSGAAGASTTSLSPLEAALAAGGFTQSQSIRVRSGNVSVDGAVTARTFDLSADKGNIEVTSTGDIDAAGATGGTIGLEAGGSVTLDSGSILSVQGQNFNDSGQGGTVALQAGSYTSANTTAPTDTRNSTTGLFTGGEAVDIAAGSTINLSIVDDHALQLNPGGASSATPDGSIAVPGGTAVYFPGGTPGDDTVSFTAGGEIVGSGGSVTKFTASSTQPYVTALASGSTVTLSSSGKITFSGGTGGSIPLALPYDGSGGTAINLSAVNITDLSAYNSTGVLTLVAPQVLGTSGSSKGVPIDVRIDPIAGTIEGASSIDAEGLYVLNLTPKTGTSATITATDQGLVQQNGALFAGGYILNDDGSATEVAGNTASIVTSLAGSNAALSGLIQVAPEAEIVNTTGSLVLDTTWDFATTGTDSATGNSVMVYRYGPNNAVAGSLILRASGNVVLGQSTDDDGNPTFGSLSDGFTAFDGVDNDSLISAGLLPSGSQSWSFRLAAGADVTAAEATRLLPEATLAAASSGQGTGSILLGNGSANLSTFAVNTPSDFFQTIRTGTGGIGLYAGLDIQLQDNLFSIYTAGTQVDPLANFEAEPGDQAGPQFASGGGDVTVVAQRTIEHVNLSGQPDSSKELPMNWLDRQGSTNATTGLFTAAGGPTGWWVDYTNFFEGIGALGGGNVSMTAGGSIDNVDAVVPTNEQTTAETSLAATGGSAVDSLAADQMTLELGGGDLSVEAGQNINGGVYYVERGQGALQAGGSILTNQTRATVSAALAAATPADVTSSANWLPTTLFLGDGSFTVQAAGNVLLGPVANPFLLPAPAQVGPFFSTYALDDAVSVSSLTGSVTLKDDPDGDQGTGGGGSLADWLGLISGVGGLTKTLGSTFQPWLALDVSQVSQFDTPIGIMPPSISATTYVGDIDLIGGFNLSPAPDGELVLDAAGSISGFQPNSASTTGSAQLLWASAVVDLSDANPAEIPGLADPSVYSSNGSTFTTLNSLFAESGSITGSHGVLQTQEALHSPGLLHADDPNPLVMDASGGSISGLTLYSAKFAQVSAGENITDVGLYVQNDEPGDITTVTAGGDILPYDPSSPLRLEAATAKGIVGTGAAAPGTDNPTAGDIQIAGPGTLEVLAGGSINLGEPTGAIPTNGTSVGVTSIGNSGNPYLPFGGSSIVMAAGISGLGTTVGAAPGLADSKIDFADFISEYVNPATAPANAARYLPELADMLGVTVPAGDTPQQIWTLLQGLPSSSPAEWDNQLALDVFYLVLRDSGRDHNDPSSTNYGAYTAGYAAIQTLFPGSQTTAGSTAADPWDGSITMATRLVETTNGGDISLLAPGGEVLVGRTSDPQGLNQGILTESGGNISIYALNDIDVGVSRIFTLKGGSEVLWSTLGGIDAGTGSKTVHSAPPSRVLISPQSAAVQNDLAGLSTGSGIGVLATLSTVAAGDVDLIAPVGTINAGEAGIRSSGSINVSALHILNANNIQAAGTTTGVPVTAAPNIGGLTAASSASAASSAAASQVAAQQQEAAQTQTFVVPSIIEVRVLGYGGGDDVSDGSQPGGQGAG